MTLVDGKFYEKFKSIFLYRPNGLDVLNDTDQKCNLNITFMMKNAFLQNNKLQEKKHWQTKTMDNITTYILPKEIYKWGASFTDSF